MAKYIKNDEGRIVVSVGASKSLMNLRCRRPMLLKTLEELRTGYLSIAPHKEECPWYVVQDWLDREQPDATEGWELKLIAEHMGFDADEVL